MTASPTDDPVLADYHRDGFVLLRSVVAPGLVARLTSEIEEAAGADAEPNPLSVDTMRFASNLYRRSASLRDFLRSDAVVKLVTAVLGPDVWCRWDQAVWKGPGAPEFPWHQDNGYTGLPVAHLQLWLALTPMHLENGALLVQPGAHDHPRAHRWSGSHVQLPTPPVHQVVEAHPGDVLLFSSLLPHATAPNRTDTTRLAYVAEFLPLRDDDPSVPLPHLVVAEGGRPSAVGG